MCPVSPMSNIGARVMNLSFSSLRCQPHPENFMVRSFNAVLCCVLECLSLEHYLPISMLGGMGKVLTYIP